MPIFFLGNGSAYNPAFKNTGAYFVENETLFLFDCGETVFESISATGLLTHCKQIIVIITHFHSDHIGSLGSLLSYCYCRLHKKATIIYPEDTICSLLRMTGVPDEMYDHIAGLKDGIIVQAASVEHDPMICCYGYFVKSDEHSFFYGGDSASIPFEALSALQSGEISEIYQDTTYPDEHASACHGSLCGLCRQVEPALRAKVFCMHFDHDFYAQIQAEGFSVAMPEIKL